MKVQDLISEAESLPVEKRALVVAALLRSLNPPEAEIDSKWAEVARRRLDDIRAGRVETVPGDEVFEKIRNRFRE